MGFDFEVPVQSSFEIHIYLFIHLLSASMLNSDFPLIVIQLEHSGYSHKNFFKSALL